MLKQTKIFLAHTLLATSLMIPCVAQGAVPVVYIDNNLLAYIDTAVNKANETTKKIEESIQTIKKSTFEGVTDFLETHTEAITDQISSATEAVSDKISEVKDAASDKLSAAKDTVSDKIKDTMGSSDTASNSKPGSGFTDKLKNAGNSVKSAYTAANKAITPVLSGGGLLQMLNNPQTSQLYIDREKGDKITTAEINQTRRNVTNYIHESSATSVTDATNIINGTAAFQKHQDAANKAAKPTTKSDALKKKTEADIIMNAMTGVLLSMDVSKLGVAAGGTYQNINKAPNNVSSAFQNVAGSAIGGF